MKVMGMSERVCLDGAPVKIVSILDAVAASGDQLRRRPSPADPVARGTRLVSELTSRVASSREKSSE